MFSPELFRIFGPLQAELSIEDKPILLRALLAGEVAYVPHTLVRYRRHSGAVSVGMCSAKTLEEAFDYHRRKAGQQLEKYRQYRLDAITWKRVGGPNSVPDDFFRQLDKVVFLYNLKSRMCGRNRGLQWMAFVQSWTTSMPLRERIRWLLWLMRIPVKLAL